MAFDWTMAVRSLHVIAAALWVGGAFFMAFRMGPHLKAAGPAAGPLMMVAMRRGGFGPYFGAFATLTLLSGVYVFYQMGLHSDPFGDPRSSLLTVGAAFAVLIYLHSVAVLMPNEGRMKKLVKSLPPGPPPPEAGAKMAEMAAYQGKHSVIAGLVLGLVLVLMTLSRAFT